jgi:levansucrase
MTTAWTPDHVRHIAPGAAALVPAITAVDRSGLADGLLYWDMWPIQDQFGRVAAHHGRELWMALTAPDRGDPGLRHFEAKIRLLERRDGRWRDLGPVLPDQPVPYEREWAGSAMTDGLRVSLFFTGAGTATRPGGYQQALYEAHATLGADGLPTGWSAPALALGAGGVAYQPADAHEGEPGRIKAFRDPAWFRDPADGAEYLVFTASLAGSTSAYNGAVGIARRTASGWQPLPPLIHADGVNNELERAHLVWHKGRYYAFWATQRGTFAPALRHAPTGLYGMVADRLAGPWRPLNGSGLVLANPEDEPTQTYSWFVSADLVVSSFVDVWGLGGTACPSDPAALAARFGGVPAPLLRLAIDGDACTLAD